MIKLEDISIKPLVSYAQDMGRVNEMWQYLYKLLYDVSDYQKLKELLDSNSSDLQYESVLKYLRDELEMVERNIKNANVEGRCLEIFKFDNEVSMIDKNTLQITDDENTGVSLLYCSPMQRCGGKITRLNRLSVSEIKHMIGHVDNVYLKNMFLSMRGIGMETVRKLADSVKFYNKQLLRQSMETEERGINLFTFNKRLKDEIVESEIKEIVEYLVDNAKECVWGELSDTQKKHMVMASLSYKGCYVQKDKKALIDMVSDYTTLSELEQGVVRKRTLDRFIVR